MVHDVFVSLFNFWLDAMIRDGFGSALTAAQYLELTTLLTVYNFKNVSIQPLLNLIELIDQLNN